jgi:hypothetical protein
MFNLTILCITLAIITAAFWASEWPWGKKGMEFVRESRFLLMDVFFTIVIVKVFSLGGLIGTTMGFAISNVISLAILFSRHTSTKEEEPC